MLILRSRFRWAACQLDLLGDCFSVRHLRQALASLPKTLDDTYARILLNIDKKHNHYYREILKILQWLTFSAEPLRLEELVEIVAIDIDETPRFDPERRWPEPQDILMICSSLVTLTTNFDEGTDDESSGQYIEEEYDIEFDASSQESDTDSRFEASDCEGSMIFVRLAHFSVKEYLVSDRIQHGIAARYSIREIESHGILAGDCIAYLLQFDKPNYLTSETAELSPLARYAAVNWTDHARQAQKGPVNAAASLSMELFMSGEGGLLNWVRNTDPDDNGSGDLILGIRDLSPPIYYASLAGLSESVNMMIEKNIDVNAEGGRLRSALHAASFSGHMDTVQLLLDHGADVKASGLYGSPLCTACVTGDHRVAELLLNKGADVNACGEGEVDYGTPLQMASDRGYENLVKLLLDKGANVNATSDECGASSLKLASSRGHENVVKMLLDKGADVDTQREWGTAFQLASASGHKDIVKMLLEKGTDVNAYGEEGNTLQLASANSYESVVKMLLEKGADVNAKSAKGRRNALQLGPGSSRDNVVRSLLESEADVNGCIGSEPSALQRASRNGHEIIVKMLLEKGADVNAQGPRGNALQCASEADLGNVVKMLLDREAEVNAQQECSDSALQSTSRIGDENVVKMLLEKGADVIYQGRRSSSALQLASHAGYENIVKMLLEKGADVNATSLTERRNALQLASINDDDTVNTMSLGQRRLALGLEPREAYANIVKILLAKGAVMPKEDDETSQEEHEEDEDESETSENQPEDHLTGQDVGDPEVTPFSRAVADIETSSRGRHRLLDLLFP